MTSNPDEVVTSNRASLAMNARCLSAFAVDAKFAGNRPASIAAPKCCWHTAARAVLKVPVRPEKDAEVDFPNAAR